MRHIVLVLLLITFTNAKAIAGGPNKLYKYIKQGNLKKVQEEFAKDTVILGFDATPLDVAFQYNHPDIFEYLDKQGVESTIADDESLLSQAVEKGWLEMIRVLLESDHHGNYNPGGEVSIYHAVHHSIANNNPQLFDVLLANGGKYAEKYRPYALDVVWYQANKIVPLLKKYDIINNTNHEGLTALDILLIPQAKHETLIELFKENGAQLGIDLENEPFRKAQIAVRTNNLAWLQEQDHTVLFANVPRDSEYPLDEARAMAAQPLFFLALETRHNELLEFLSEYTTTYATDPLTNYSAVVTALKNSNLEGAQWAASHGFTTETPLDGDTCITPLHILTHSDVEDDHFVAMLPYFKGMINLKTCKENHGFATPLHLAVNALNHEKSKAMLEAGGDPNIPYFDKYLLDIADLNLAHFDEKLTPIWHERITRMRELLIAHGAKSAK